jgi:hypothetical protein
MALMSRYGLIIRPTRNGFEFYANTQNLNNNVLKLKTQSGFRYFLGNLVSLLIIYMGFNLLSHNALQIEVNGKTLGKTVVFESKKEQGEDTPNK